MGRGAPGGAQWPGTQIFSQWPEPEGDGIPGGGPEGRGARHPNPNNIAPAANTCSIRGACFLMVQLLAFGGAALRAAQHRPHASTWAAVGPEAVLAGPEAALVGPAAVLVAREAPAAPGACPGAFPAAPEGSLEVHPGAFPAALGGCPAAFPAFPEVCLLGVHLEACLEVHPGAFPASPEVCLLGVHLEACRGVHPGACPAGLPAAAPEAR